MHWLHCIFSELVRWSPDSIMQLSSACILTGNIWDGWPPFQFLGYRVLFSYQVTTMKTKDTLHYSKSIIYFRPIDLMLLFSLKKFLQKPVIQYRSDGVIQYLEAGKKRCPWAKAGSVGHFLPLSIRMVQMTTDTLHSRCQLSPFWIGCRAEAKAGKVGSQLMFWGSV